MDIKEISDLSIEEEKKHWWIQTRFNYIDAAIKKVQKEQINVYEFGCGSAQNLWYLRESSSHRGKIQSVAGIDPELPSDFQPKWLKPQDKIINNFSDINHKSDLILAMDVLEHIDDDENALKEWLKHLDDDGVILITVPAFQSLWSYHDEFLDHKRRYTKGEILDLTEKCGLTPVYSGYAFGHLFPFVYLIRKIFRGNKQKASSDLKPPPFLINSLLKFVGYLEYILGGNKFWGTSVVGIFKKDAKTHH